MKKRTIILVSAVAAVLIITLAAVFAVPKITARTISIFEIVGENVQITKGSEKEFAAKAGMSLFNGYTVSTDVDSYAYLHLDEESLIKMDYMSKVKVNRPTSKKLSVAILSGALAIDAATQTGGQMIEIQTNNAALAIRGTYIVVQVTENTAEFAILEGSGEVDGHEAPFGSVMVVTGDAGEKTYDVLPVTVDESVSQFLLQAIIDNAETLINGGILTEDDIAKAQGLLNGAGMSGQDEDMRDSQPLADANSPIGSDSGGDGEFLYGADYINENLKGDYWAVYNIQTHSNGETNSVTMEQIKTSDGYYWASDGEGMLFIKNGENYDVYAKYDGTFESINMQYTKEMADNMMAGMMMYMTAYQSYDIMMKSDGSQTVAGRDCAKYTYDYTYPGMGYKYKYIYCIDKSTGVCLKFTMDLQSEGQKIGYEFECSKFQTSGVSLPAYR